MEVGSRMEWVTVTVTVIVGSFDLGCECRGIWMDSFVQEAVFFNQVYFSGKIYKTPESRDRV
jgi:Zn-finger nucleic acid-binding protein